MRETAPPSPAVVVGIDGSRRAIDAALWAVDEAVDREIPLRLVYAIEPREHDATDPSALAHDFAAAESAVRTAAMAIESSNRPVKIEVEITQGHPVAVLLAASRSAAMLCIGALGVNHATGRRLGSAATQLLKRARCPVAIVRGDEGTRTAAGNLSVITEFHNTPSGPTVLRRAIDEARLRHAPLRVITGWQPTVVDIHDARATADGTRQAKAQLERALARYRRMYPEVDIKAIAVAGSPINYIARHADSIQLVVVGQDPLSALSELGGPGGNAALANQNCSTLVAERHGAL